MRRTVAAAVPNGYRDVRNLSTSWQVVAVVAGTLALALSSYVRVPMYPVPMTMQTLAVPLVGMLYGWRLGTITITAWLVQGALGLPVLSGGASGAHHFGGPTGGYLFAFPIAGALAGWLAERGWNGRRIGLAFLAMAAANAICLALGCAWLSATVGVEKAVALGVVPFLAGALVKSALGAVLLAALARRPRR